MAGQHLRRLSSDQIDDFWSASSAEAPTAPGASRPASLTPSQDFMAGQTSVLDADSEPRPSYPLCVTKDTNHAPTLQEVFKIGGVPQYTFVKPSRWTTLISNLRTPGRGLVIEGPSGIGKTTAVKQALAELGRTDTAQILSARRPKDVEFIEILTETVDFGLVVVDDFHRLSDNLRGSLADLMKALADEESETSKLVIVGINQAGNTLIKHAPDVTNRLDVIRMEVEPPNKISEMISKGESALNVSIEAKEPIIEGANGSFYVAQLLCNEACTEADILEAPTRTVSVNAPYPTLRRRVTERQEARFNEVFTKFARGNKFRPGGRAPYLQILRWLQESDGWTISLNDEIRKHPEARASVQVVLKNGYFNNLVRDDLLSQVVHLDTLTNVLAIEDPQAAFYLRNLDLAEFAKSIGFRKIDFSTSYDVALSFAGEDREFAEALNDQLEDRGLAVFYDFTEQARVLGEDLENFFRPIYESEADYVVAIFGPTYGSKRWPRFESDLFKSRFDEGHVIPIWSQQVPEAVWDKSRERGGLSFDPSGDLRSQAESVAALVSDKITQSRY